MLPVNFIELFLQYRVFVLECVMLKLDLVDLFFYCIGDIRFSLHYKLLFLYLLLAFFAVFNCFFNKEIVSLASFIVDLIESLFEPIGCDLTSDLF
jgi:hypothetical protein